MLIRKLTDLGQPVREAVEACPVCDVVDQECADGIPVVNSRNREELLGAGGVPYLGLHALIRARQRERHCLELDAIRRLWALDEAVVAHPLQQIRFADALVTNDDDLVEVVELLLRVIQHARGVSVQLVALRRHLRTAGADPKHAPVGRFLFAQVRVLALAALEFQLWSGGNVAGLIFLALASGVVWVIYLDGRELLLVKSTFADGLVAIVLIEHGVLVIARHLLRVLDVAELAAAATQHGQALLLAGAAKLELRRLHRRDLVGSEVTHLIARVARAKLALDSHEAGPTHLELLHLRWIESLLDLLLLQRDGAASLVIGAVVILELLLVRAHVAHEYVSA